MNTDRILITGSNGLIGGIIWPNLLDDYEIFGIDKSNHNKNSRTITADLSHYDQIFNIVRNISPLSYIIHLAANSSEDAGLKSVWKNNIIATMNIYSAARICGVKRIIFISSNLVVSHFDFDG